MASAFLWGMFAASSLLLGGLLTFWFKDQQQDAGLDHGVGFRGATLGYGDIVMSPRWRLLGPLQAINGTLALGWSTAVIVTVVTRLAHYRHRAQVRRGHSLPDRRK
jgi:hypothetical protein